MFTKCLVVFGLIVLIGIYFPTRHARHYKYVEDHEILDELIKLNRNSLETNLNVCSYEDIVLNGSEIDQSQMYRSQFIDTTLKGGEYMPKNCIPLYKSAIIIPYRNRTSQLRIFLNYMHKYLQAQNLHYRIFVIDQNDNLPFNRARMLNYGAKVAISLGINCLILHDVDLLPINTGNLYACSKRPRHMSSSIDVFRYNLPYLSLFGGVVAIQSAHFQEINGMSNLFYGWGGEDDDFYLRLEAHNLLPYRFSPKLSKYVMLNHKKEKGSQERFNRLKHSLEHHKTDGLNSLGDNVIIKLEDLYTHVVVT